MFAVAVGEFGAGLENISAMATGLHGEGPLRVWHDARHGFGAAAKPHNLLPEDAFETQPFVDADLVFVCRARLDSRAELLRELSIGMAEGAAMSDGEILRLAYRKWREATPQHVYGDFAFVAWERTAKRLVAATDHLATFPLFYCLRGQHIVLGEQLSALLAHPLIEVRLDQRALGLMAAPKLGRRWTMFEGISHLPGGEILIYTAGSLSLQQWWQPNDTPHIFYADPREYVEEVSLLFDAAVATRLRANGEIAATMSSGLDSTLVAATAARLLHTNGRELQVFTAIPQPGLDVSGFDGRDVNEGPWAEAVAALHPNMRHQVVPPDGIIALDLLPKVHASSLTPIRNTANLVWGASISTRAASQQARVVLSGDHGNSSISYDAQPNGSSIWHRFRRPTFWRNAASRVRSLVETKLQQSDQRCGMEVMSKEFCEIHRQDLRKMAIPATQRERFTSFLTRPIGAPRLDPMALFGVEWRDPTGDRRLLERLLAYPLSAFRPENQDRGLARELGSGLLPDRVRLKRTRGEQSADQAAWFSIREKDYRAAFDTVRQSSISRSFLDIPRLEAMLNTLYCGAGSNLQAIVAQRALDVGTFAAAYENGTLFPNRRGHG